MLGIDIDEIMNELKNLEIHVDEVEENAWVITVEEDE